MTDALSSTPRELPLLLGPGNGMSEMLLLIGVPDAAGILHVRSWSADDWSAVPDTRAERASSLLAWTERQLAAGRSANQSLYAIRLWLLGGDAG